MPAKRVKKRNGSNIRKTSGVLAPLQLGGNNGRGHLAGHKSAIPQRPKKGSDFVDIYTSSLPLTLKLQQ